MVSAPNISAHCQLRHACVLCEMNYCRVFFRDFFFGGGGGGWGAHASPHLIVLLYISLFLSTEINHWSQKRITVMAAVGHGVDKIWVDMLSAFWSINMWNTVFGGTNESLNRAKRKRTRTLTCGIVGFKCAVSSSRNSLNLGWFNGEFGSTPIAHWIIYFLARFLVRTCYCHSDSIHLTFCAYVCSR